jgi:predicted AlkP superfamily pyrophosphatase or phosphodiesterase
MTPLMLPAAPKDVGRLSDVFVSALASVGGGGDNRLRLPKVRHAVVILVDGLGYENLQNAPAYSRFLNQHLVSAIRCEFPSTTATSITGFATGTRSNEHGMVGYSVFDRKTRSPMNLLTGWTNAKEAQQFKQVPAIAESAKGVEVFAIGPGAYEKTGFTEITMAGARYMVADRIQERFEVVEKITRQVSKSLTYLYVPELDQLAHKFGVSSNEWLNALEELDLVVNRFIAKNIADLGVILTADHGVIDVANDRHVHLDEFDWYTKAVVSTAGDPRCNFVYLNEGVSAETLKSELQQNFGRSAYVCEPHDLIETGWMAHFSVNRAANLPDLFIIWNDAMVAYDRRFSKPNHLKMVGQHGGISDIETRIPLIKLGKF